MKKTMLLYCDSPLITTGFGNVAKYLTEALQSKYDLTVCAINQYQEVQGQESEKQQYKLYLADKTPFNIEKMRFLITEKTWDYIFLFNDWNILAQFNQEIEVAKKNNPTTKIIAYTPIDTEFIPSLALVPLLQYDVIVSYTDFGKRIIEMGQPSLKDQGKVKVIGHGTDNGIFKPLSESHIRKDRKEIFGLKDSDFFVLNVSRNQWRKDIPRSMQLVKTFKDGKIFKKDSKLLYFINSKVEDMGGDLLDITFALECQDFVKFPDPKYFSEIVGVTPEFLNKLYNMADVLVSTTMGEGWGLPITEAMAAKTPVLAPYNSSIMEIIGVDEKRGYFIPSGTTTSEYFVYGSESSLLHPLANLEGGVKKLNKIYQDKFGLTYTGETLEKINNGYEYANFFNWEYIKQKWITLLEELDNE